MSFIQTNPLKNSTIMLIYAEREEIKLDPVYQRQSDVWTKEKKQLLIDSILNNYDIPKIYFHIYDRKSNQETGIAYSVIDGRQRLETIWQFIEGEFPLSSDFEYQKDTEINMKGLTYSDIAKEFPRIKIQFDSFILPIVGVETDDIDLIEDMFSRLNEAVPLNAAEKRNAFGGAAVKAIRDIAGSDLFVNRVRFTNKRYQHLEVAARILLTEDSLQEHGKIVDTKKVYLDKFAKVHVNDRVRMRRLVKEVTRNLSLMCDTFSQSDEILKAQGNMVLYYLLFRKASLLGELEKLKRRKFLNFRVLLSDNRARAEKNYSESSYELLEFDRLAQQGTNDASNIKERFRILSSYMELSETEI
ncbi:DUF262 domain-containing protein [Pseudoalteromonas piscicida]|uniref:DUF262 domain-containing protein n=1 Tax=Pseudoalteromonas TaxID=53246 RepID=UPI0030C995F1